jgi:hypothetical protein
LVIEVYRELGMKFDEAIDELNTVLAGDAQKPKKPKPQDEAAGLAMLQAVVGASDFRGAKG